MLGWICLRRLTLQLTVDLIPINAKFNGMNTVLLRLSLINAFLFAFGAIIFVLNKCLWKFSAALHRWIITIGTRFSIRPKMQVGPASSCCVPARTSWQCGCISHALRFVNFTSCHWSKPRCTIVWMIIQKACTRQSMPEKSESMMMPNLMSCTRLLTKSSGKQSKNQSGHLKVSCTQVVGESPEIRLRVALPLPSSACWSSSGPSGELLPSSS